MSLELRDEVVISLGVWRKGVAAITIEQVNDTVRIIPVVGNPFYIKGDDWPTRKAIIEGEGWVRDGQMIEESDFVDEAESQIWVKDSARPTLRMLQGYESGFDVPRQPSTPTNLGELPHGVFTIPPPQIEVPEDMASKILIPKDTVLRRKDEKLYLMTHQEGGWDNFSFPVESEEMVAEKFNVRLGQWSEDEYGEFCPVTKVSHRVILKPPRP